PRKQAGHMTASDKGTDHLKNVLQSRSHPHKPFGSTSTPAAASTVGNAPRSADCANMLFIHLYAMLIQPVGPVLCKLVAE
ncbi:hypothetical protein, partial [Pseudovibrio sp. POLY-S9]|uniref:hypothetical protein n=1 Tax=Pseudovibrio sp. POLY-S9 TaxID=1576596 RepID=UPI001AD8B627